MLRKLIGWARRRAHPERYLLTTYWWHRIYAQQNGQNEQDLSSYSLHVQVRGTTKKDQ